MVVFFSTLDSNSSNIGHPNYGLLSKNNLPNPPWLEYDPL